MVRMTSEPETKKPGWAGLNIGARMKDRAGSDLISASNPERSR